MIISGNEHLLFSTAYCNFCTEVIEQQFDHQSDLLPMADHTGQFNGHYEYKIDLYKTEFNTALPADIWGATKFDKAEIKRNKEITIRCIPAIPTYIFILDR